MLEQATRSALFRAAEAGFEQAARAEISRVDPLLRGRVTKRMRLAIDAGAELTGPVDDVIDEAQQLRVAYLKHVGSLGEVDPKDGKAVGVAFARVVEKAPPKSVGRLWPVTPLVLLVVLGGGGLIGWRVFGPSEERRLRDSVLGQAVGKDLTKWVVAAGRFRQARDGFQGVDTTKGKLKETQDKLLASTKEALGDEGAKAMEELLDAAKAIEGAGVRGVPAGPGEKAEDEERPEDEKKVQAAAKKLNELLSAAGKPVVIDSQTLPMMLAGADGNSRPFRDVYLMSYWVARRGKLDYAGKDTPIRLGKRLDTVDVTVNVEGYDTEALGGVLVSLDVAERRLIRRLMKPLAGNTPWELTAKESAARLEGGDKMLDKAGEVLRAELLGSAGVSQESANSIAALLDQRAQTVGDVTELKISAPSKLLFDDDTRERLEHFTKEKLEVFSLVEIDDKLRGYERDFHDILIVFADSSAVRGTVAILEEKGGEMPKALEEALGGKEDEKRAAIERMVMLAELAAIATSEKLARTLLSLVTSELLEGYGNVGRAALVAVLSEIAVELGVKPADPWIDGTVITKNFPAFYSAMIDKSTDEVRRAAETAFQRASGQKVPKLTWD